MPAMRCCAHLSSSANPNTASPARARSPELSHASGRWSHFPAGVAAIFERQLAVVARRPDGCPGGHRPSARPVPASCRSRKPSPGGIPGKHGPVPDDTTASCWRCWSPPDGHGCRELAPAGRLHQTAYRPAPADSQPGLLRRGHRPAPRGRQDHAGYSVALLDLDQFAGPTRPSARPAATTSAGHCPAAATGDGTECLLARVSGDVFGLMGGGPRC